MAFFLLTFAFTSLLAAPEQDTIHVALAARSVQPGEIVLLTMTIGGAPPTDVRVRVFGKEIPAFKVGDGEWRALVGIDIDQRAGRYVAAIEAARGGITLRQAEALIVKPRQFPTRTLRVDPDFVNPPPAVAERIEREARFLRETLDHVTSERLWSTPFVRPVHEAANSSFGTRSIFNGEPRSPHGGTDFLSPQGTPVKSPNAGRVLAARELYFTGNTVIVDHGLGVVSMLAHLSRIEVREGDTVAAGQILGLVGATGRVTGPHLHWALRVSRARVDPLSALAVVGESGSSQP